MALPKGTKRYQHVGTGEIRYFKNPPNKEMWNKVGTPGSKLWKWVTNGTDEQYISSTTGIPEGYSCGRLRK
jgi:hypothetical protein